MLGEFDEARENVDRAKQAADRNPPNERGTIPILEIAHLIALFQFL
jgi:hypothetical protein